MTVMATARRGAAALLLALILASCAAPASAVPALGPLPPAGRADVYAALGASETAGVGISDDPLRLRAAWPQLFFNEVLSRASTLYNLAIPGITTQEALAAELAPALALRPTVATVFFGVDDLTRGVTPEAYEANLDRIVHALRQSGRASVLVANSPRLDDLPAYGACREGRHCPLGPAAAIPPPATVDALIAAYNAAVARVAQREGATVVDLAASSADLVAHPEYLAPDGLHPSALGAAELARRFAAAYAASGRRG